MCCAYEVTNIKNKHQKLFGFEMQDGSFSCKFFLRDVAEHEKWIKQLSRLCISKNFEKRYAIQNQLGKGAFAKVGLAVEKLNFLGC